MNRSILLDLRRLCLAVDVASLPHATLQQLHYCARHAPKPPKSNTRSASAIASLQCWVDLVHDCALAKAVERGICVADDPLLIPPVTTVHGSAAESPSIALLALPTEILAVHLLPQLGWCRLARLGGVCRTLYHLIHHPSDGLIAKARGPLLEERGSLLESLDVVDKEMREIMRPANAAIASLGKRDLAEVLNFRRPPTLCEELFVTVVRLVNLESSSKSTRRLEGWDQAKKKVYTNIAGFMSALMKFNPLEIDDSQQRLLDDYLAQAPTVDEMMMRSLACAKLLIWIRGVGQAHSLLKPHEEDILRLVRLKDELAQLRARG